MNKGQKNIDGSNKNSKSNKSSAPRYVRIPTLRHPVNVRPANAIEKAGLKGIVNNIIDKMLVCEEGPHTGEFIAPHRLENGSWHNVLTYLHRNEAFEHIKKGVFRGL